MDGKISLPVIMFGRKYMNIPICILNMSKAATEENTTEALKTLERQIDIRIDVIHL